MERKYGSTFVYTHTNQDRYLFRVVREDGAGGEDDEKCSKCDLYNNNNFSLGCNFNGIYNLTGSCANRVFKILRVKRIKK